MARPRLLDLFCGAGGAAVGYHRAGFDVVGVDNRPQPHYPFSFVQLDALAVLSEMVDNARDERLWESDDFDAIHASPPCQSYSRRLRHMSAKQPQLIEPLRELLEERGLPWIIENVEGAPLARATTLDGRNGLELCGTMFGLRVGWHRLFETSFPTSPPARSCRCASMHLINPFFSGGRNRIYAEFGRGTQPDWPEVVWRQERGTPWMGRYEAREAIPPAYTELIGHQLLAHIQAVAA